MGYATAAGFAECVAEGQVSLDAALEYHLTANHYPPIPVSMVGPCKRAIKAARERKRDRKIRLPKGVTWRGQKSAPAWALIEGQHLDAFI